MNAFIIKKTLVNLLNEFGESVTVSQKILDASHFLVKATNMTSDEWLKETFAS